MKENNQAKTRHNASGFPNPGGGEEQPLTPRILILGVGNILLSDEGAGIRAIQELQRQYSFPAEVELMDAGTSGMQLLPWIENRSDLFIIDIVNEEEVEPGGVVQYNYDDPPAFIRTKSTSHQIGLHEVLAFSQMSNTLPSRIVLFGIRPLSFDTGLELSMQVNKGLQELIQMIVKELECLEIYPAKLND
ncbi:MAG: HyaD/HybD family hydrogenase maturation endopeptidase [Thermodesulfobacteriota bacterium]